MITRLRFVRLRSVLRPLAATLGVAAATLMMGCEGAGKKHDAAALIQGYDYYASERLGGFPDDSVPVSIGWADPGTVEAGRGSNVYIDLDDYADPYGQVIKVTYPLNGNLLRSQINRTFVRPFLDSVSLPLVTKPSASAGQTIEVRMVSLKPNGDELPPAVTETITVDPPGTVVSGENHVKDADVIPSSVAAGKGVEIRVDIKTTHSTDDGQLIKVTYSTNAANYLEDTPAWIYVQPGQRRVKLTLLTKAAGTVTMYFAAAAIDGTVVQTTPEDVTFQITN